MESTSGPADSARGGRFPRRELLGRAAALGVGLGTSGALLALGDAPAVAVPAATPRPGGRSIWAAESDPVSLNPITNSLFASVQGFEHCYESLTAYDAKMNIVPALAQSWETPNETTYIFHLRRGVRWHDGTEFTADDVAYTFGIVLDPKGPAVYRSNFDQVDKVQVVDKHTVKLLTKAPFPPLLGAFAILRSSAIVQKGALDKYNMETQIVGTGPYRLAEYVPKSYLRLVRNRDYWGKPLPYLDEVLFKIMTEEDARVAGLRARSIDYAFLTPLGEQRLRSERGLTILKGPRIFLYVFQINMLRKPWSDVRVRRALNLAVDRREMIAKALNGAGTVSGPIATGFGHWFVPPAELERKWYVHDPEEAKRLLKGAGVPEGQPLDLLVTPFGGSGFYTAAAVVFKEQMQKVGIDVKIRQVEPGVFDKEISPPTFNYDIQINAFTPRHDPDGFLWNRFYSKNAYADGYSNPKVDDLLLRARTTVNPAQRKALYDEVQRLLLADVPMLWIAVDQVIEGLQDYVQGYQQSPFTRRDWGLKHAWLQK